MVLKLFCHDGVKTRGLVFLSPATGHQCEAEASCGSVSDVPAWKAMTSWINTEMEENLVIKIWWTKIYKNQQPG
jgi:hypothetical protein